LQIHGDKDFLNLLNKAQVAEPKNELPPSIANKKISLELKTILI